MLSRSMRTPRPSRMSRFSNGMRVMCARISPVSVSSVGSSTDGDDAGQPIRSKYSSALNKFDFGAAGIFDEREADRSGRELQVRDALHDLDAFEIGERPVEIRDAPADVIERVAGARRRRRLRFLHEHEHVAVLQRVGALELDAVSAEA